ncbi:tRNA pseudouridine(55) synthase TruB [Devriesea agamarum]|uniref:tRNA pseudouridine(55) synthase TruB n=1 Tax=Devriesea agamarum TaxID=472569 RepID=UPI001E2C1862
MRRVAGTKKVGHAGTLDPMATGLLLVGIGQGTRLLTYLVGLPKTYTATIRLGQATTTDDAEGTLIADQASTGHLTSEAVENAIDTLRGEIQQVPSSVSAIKVNGQRAYARARAGEEVKLAARPVVIHRFETVGQARHDDGFYDIDVVVECSSGTYIRALARDLGANLGVGGHLTALRRTHVGPFSVSDAVLPPPRGDDDKHLVGLGLGKAASMVMPSLRVSAEIARDLGHGKRPEVDLSPIKRTETQSRVKDASVPEIAALDDDGKLVAIVTAGGKARSQSVDAISGMKTVRGSLRPLLVIPVDAQT